MTGLTSSNRAVTPPANGESPNAVHSELAGQPCGGVSSTSLFPNGAQKKSPARNLRFGRIAGSPAIAGSSTQGATCNGVIVAPSRSISICLI